MQEVARNPDLSEALKHPVKEVMRDIKRVNLLLSETASLEEVLKNVEKSLD